MRTMLLAAGGPGPGGGGPGGRGPGGRWSAHLGGPRPPRRPPPTAPGWVKGSYLSRRTTQGQPERPVDRRQGSELGSRYIAGPSAALANACSGKSVGGTLRNSHVRGHRKGHRARSTGMGHPESTRRVAWLEFSSQSRRQRGQLARSAGWYR